MALGRQVYSRQGVNITPSSSSVADKRRKGRRKRKQMAANASTPPGLNAGMPEDMRVAMLIAQLGLGGYNG